MTSSTKLENKLAILSMFHVKHINLGKYKIHELLFYLFLFVLPIQTRILYSPEKAYISWYFSYPLAFFVYLTDLILLTCFISWFLFDPPKFSLENRLFKLILALFGLVLVTLFHVKRLDLGFYSSLKWLELFLLFFYIYYTFEGETKFHKAFGLIFVSGIIQALLAIMQFHVQHSLGLRFLGEYIPPLGTPGLSTIDYSGSKIIRAYGTLPHPNILGAFLVFALISGLFYVSSFFTKVPAGGSEDRRAKTNGKFLVSGLPATALATAGGTILIVLGIFFSFSRLAWISALVVFLLFFFYDWLKANRKSLIVLLIILMVACGIILMGYNPLLLHRAGENLESNAINLRAFFNHLSVLIIEKYPLLGVGTGNYLAAMQDFYKLEPWQYQPPHNIFLLLLAELGILGVSLFAIILFEIIKFAWQQSRSLLGYTLIATALIFIFMGNFDHYFLTIQQGRLMFFTVLGLVAALPNIYDHQKLN